MELSLWFREKNYFIKNRRLKIFNYRGNIHIHSVYSDGTGTIPEIAASAEDAGLDYIIINDHHHNRDTSEEGFYRGVAVLIETELNKESNHYLAMGTKEAVPDYTDSPQKSIDAVEEQGGFGFLAHPFETGSPLISNGSALPWKDWNVKGFHGIELWNYCSQWRGKALSVPEVVFWYLFSPHNPVKSGPPPECLKKWDELTLERPIVAIGGSDNHAAFAKVGPKTVCVFPYEPIFHTVNTHIILPEPLSKEFKEAKKQILLALREGRCYISLDIYKSSGNFYFGACNQETEVPMGSEISLKGETYLKINAAGKKSTIRIIRDGQLITRRKDSFLLYKIKKPGTYRVEIYHHPPIGKPRPWIYSNPVYVKKK